MPEANLVSGFQGRKSKVCRGLIQSILGPLPMVAEVIFTPLLTNSAVVSMRGYTSLLQVRAQMGGKIHRVKWQVKEAAHSECNGCGQLMFFGVGPVHTLTRNTGA